MILVDTSVWVQHLRQGDEQLSAALDAGQVLAHPWVTGELALGHLRQGSDVLHLLDQLPQAPVATNGEVRAFVDAHGLPGSGIGYVDVQLLASVVLHGDASLWSSDRRIAAVATRLGHGRRG